MMASDEKEFKTQTEVWADKLSKRLPNNSNVSKVFLDFCNDTFEDLEELIDDLDEWENSAVIDEILRNDTVKKIDGEKLFNIIQAIINNTAENAISVTKPNEIKWKINNLQEKTKEAFEYMKLHIPQCKEDENKHLYELIAIGRQNKMNILNIIYSIYIMVTIHTHFDGENEKRKIDSIGKWLDICNGYFNFDDNLWKKKLVQRAMIDYGKRLVGSGCNEMMNNKINDYLYKYIDYVMIVQGIISNILNIDNFEICPLQIDLVIIGKNNVNVNDTDDKKEDIFSATLNNDDDDDDDEDDDDLDIPTHFDDVAVNNNLYLHPWPANIENVLKKWLIAYEKVEINRNDITIKRIIQYKMCKILSNQRNCRIIILIDCRSETDLDEIFIYKLPINNKISSDFCQEFLCEMTKNSLIPNEAMELRDIHFANAMKGAELDLGANNFVLSFHIHSNNYIQYRQFLKTQQMPFLPYHLILLWPNYFNEKFQRLDVQNEKYSIANIYKKWKLPLNDNQLNVWTQIIDPRFYQILTKYHLKYVQ